MGYPMVEGMVLLQIDGASYAVQSEKVVMVEMIGPITRVPRAAVFIEGVTAVRSQVIPVVSLRKRFELPSIETDLKTRLVVIRVNGRMIGMIADAAREYVNVDIAQMLPPPESLSGPRLDYIEGVITLDDRLVLVINLEKLFSEEERERLTEYSEG